jgi:DNA-directed RNA polymerase subunit RPC12/RpoP
MEAVGQAAESKDPAAELRRVKCPRCGHSLHRSHARGIVENVLRRVLQLRKFRCESCGYRKWRGGEGRKSREPSAAAAAPNPLQEGSRSRDHLARHLARRRFRRALLTALFIALAGLAVGLAVSRLQLSSGPRQSEQ